MATSLTNRAARFFISPRPNSLIESRSILHHVQATFGEISAFLNPRYKAQHLSPYGASSSFSRLAIELDTKSSPNQTVIHALFTSPASLNLALEARQPLKILSGHDQPDPEEEDPYNLRGFRDRVRPQKQTFLVQIADDPNADTWHARTAISNPLNSAFQSDTHAPASHDLLRTGAPLPGLRNIASTANPLPRPQDTPRPLRALLSAHLPRITSSDLDSYKAWRAAYLPERRALRQRERTKVKLKRRQQAILLRDLRESAERFRRATAEESRGENGSGEVSDAWEDDWMGDLRVDRIAELNGKDVEVEVEIDDKERLEGKMESETGKGSRPLGQIFKAD